MTSEHMTMSERERALEARVAELEAQVYLSEAVCLEIAALQSRIDYAFQLLAYSEDLLPLTRIERALEVLRG